MKSNHPTERTNEKQVEKKIDGGLRYIKYI